MLDTTTRYGLCGAMVGNFVGVEKDVDCDDCLAELKRKEKHEPVAPDGQ